MTKYEYCQVHTDYGQDIIGKVKVRVHNGVIARSSKETIATGKSYIDLFNELGELGWRMCGQAITGINLHQMDNYEPKVLQTDIIYYFERQLND